MPTVDHDIDSAQEVFCGEDKVLTFTVRDSLNAPVDVAGWSLGFEVRLTRYTPGVALLSKATGNGITTPAPTANGTVKVALASASTKDMKAGTYYYGLARTNSGAWDVVAQGKFVLRKAAVRA